MFVIVAVTAIYDESIYAVVPSAISGIIEMKFGSTENNGIGIF